MVKPSESERTLQTMGTDLFALIEHFRAEKAVTGMHSYQLLVRLFKEQCRVEEPDADQPLKSWLSPTGRFLPTPCRPPRSRMPPTTDK
jgi:hypothetical protein